MPSGNHDHEVGKDKSGGKPGGKGGGKGSEKEDKDLASQLDKSKGLPGSKIGGGAAPTEKSLGRMISDLFGGPAAYANNPNRPKFNTKTMGVPVDMSFMDVILGNNYGMPEPLNSGLNAIGMMSSGVGPGMAATRAIQAATGMSGGPSVGGFSDGKLGGSNPGRETQDPNDLANSFASLINPVAPTTPKIAPPILPGQQPQVPIPASQALPWAQQAQQAFQQVFQPVPQSFADIINAAGPRLNLPGFKPFQSA
jgi:hypothetical protein